MADVPDSRGSWNPAGHPREPAGGSAGGQFAAGSGGAAPTNQKPVGQGETGKRVSDLQARLNALGAKPPLKVDGKFGPKTLAAVRAFQRSHGLKVDGLVGPKTTAALRLKHPAGPEVPPEDKHPAPAGTAKAGRMLADDAGHAARAGTPGVHDHPGSAEKLHEYWVHGKGAAKIRWGTPGDFDRCTRELMDDAHFTPEQAHGYCNLAHKAATGMYPATHAAMEKGHRLMTGDDLIRSRVLDLDDIEILSRAKGGDGRTVVAYAAVFNSRAYIRDSDGEYDEQIDPHAFEWVTPGVFYNHARNLYGKPSDLGAVPLGRPVDIKPDGKGLLTVSRYNRSDLADAVLESIKNNDPMGMSFTGDFQRSEPSDPPYFARADGTLPLVTRQRIFMLEYGPTPYGPHSKPAYKDAEIVGVRSAGNGEREQVTLVVPGHYRMTEQDPAGERAGDPAGPQPYNGPDGDGLDGSWDDLGDLPDLTGLTVADFEAADAGSEPAAAGAGDGGESRAAPLGSGGRFKALKAKLAAKGASNPGALAAHIGRKKYGKAKFTVLAAAARKKKGSGSASGRHLTAGETERPGAARPDVRKGNAMEDGRPMTVEERAARQSEIRARLSEIDNQYSGAELTAEARAEWKSLQGEIVEHERAIADASERAEYLRYINDMNPEATERVGQPAAGTVTRAVPLDTGYGDGNGNGYGRSRNAAFHPRDNIYDLAAIRNRARHIDEVPVLYRDYAMRAVEQARFPGVQGARISREDAQERVERLLHTIDDEKGTLARRILATGSPLYDRAFGKMIAAQSTHGLTAEESRALALGTDSAGGYAVPFQLDPTVLLTSNGAINPLRQIARVEQITGKEWDGVTSAGVTVSRVAEGTEAGTGDPVFAQPAVRTTRVQGFVPFSIEMDVTWAGLRTQLTSLLMDAKDVEEGAGTSGFVLGNGTAPNAGGVVTTLGTAQQVTTAGSAALALADVYALENAMPVRFRQQSAILASKTTYNKLTQLAQAVAALAGDTWPRLSSGNPRTLNGYPAYEASAMSGSVTTTGALVALQGDFSKFLIVDRVGMGIELIPHLFGSANRYPTGQRGILAIWFNNSAILVQNAFRLLRIGP